MAMAREREFEGYVLDGMARAIWVHAFMIWSIEVEPPPYPPQGGRDVSWDEIAPDNASTRSASRKAADALAQLIAQANHLGEWPMATFFAKVSAQWDANRAYAFGEELAHLAMDTRSQDDSTFLYPRGRSRFDPVIPHFKVELDDDGGDLSWDGGLSWPTRNSSARPHCGCHTNPGDVTQILVIEDDPQLQRAYPRMMRKMYPGAEVTVVDNYDDAIGHLDTSPVGLVISDVDLVGDRTGIDVFAWVQANRPDLVDRYVFVTGGNPQVAHLHYRYVEKPATVPEIQAAIDRPAPRQNPRAKALTATRAKDFRNSGIYELRDESGVVVAKVFRDPESREWYEESMPGAPQTHYTERWRGSTQAEAIASITRRMAGGVAQIDEDDDDPSEADLDALAEAGRAIHPGTTRLTSAIAAKLIAYTKEMQPLLTQEAQERLAARMDYVFRTGVLDTQTEHSLEDIMATEVPNPPKGMVTTAAARKMVKVPISDDAAARVAECINDVLRSEARPVVASAAPVADFGARFDAAFDRLDRASGGHNYVQVYDLRQALPDLSRSAFDDGLNQLRRQKIYSMDSDDGRHVRLTPEQREAGIREAGSNLVYVARREASRSPSSVPREIDLPTLAQAVLGVMADIQPDPDANDRARERFGDEKVFIAAIWRRLQHDPRFAGMSVARFKQLLVDAQRERHLNLARADLVAAMNHQEVMASEINSLGSTFHFVIDPTADARRRRGW
jgi:ActR/RegA family two-component response regulator